jgi:rod shape-determining protein MreC
MNRRWRPFTIFLAGAALGALVYFSHDIRLILTLFTDSVTSFYLKTSDRIRVAWEDHFEQKAHLDACRNEVRRLERSVMAMRAELAECRAKEAAWPKPVRKSAPPMVWAFVRSLGYVRLGDYQRLWLERFDDFTPQRYYGALYRGNAVGVVVPKNDKPMLLLAGDGECSFAVYVGRFRAPGIAFGIDPRHMEVRYIPEWIAVKPGDRVETSGLDRLFPPGMPVGVVERIDNLQGFKNATIRLYGDTLHPDYLWITRIKSDL